MSPGARREQESKKRKKEILASARKLFNEKGYENTSIDDIVGAIDFTKGVFYHHFSSKQEVLGLLHLQNMELLESWFEKAVENGKTPTEKLIAIFRAYDKYLREKLNTSYSMYFLQDGFRLNEMPEDVRNSITSQFENCYGYIKSVIKEGIAAGDFRQDLNPRNTAVSLWGATVGIHALRVKLGIKSSPGQSESIYEDFLAAVPKGIAAVKD